LEGGGNAANTLVALSRLGIDSYLLSKWGSDANGMTLTNQLNSEAVSQQFCVIDTNGPTGFTYVLVEEETHTRTCIHTPIQSDLTLDDINTSILQQLANGSLSFDLIHFDSRHTEAALAIASIGKNKGILLSIDCEKDRPPYFRHLLQIVDVIFTNQHFISTFLSKEQPSFDNFIEDHISNMIDLYINLSGSPRLIVSTLGSEGSLLIMSQSQSTDNITSDKPISSSLQQLCDLLINSPIQVSTLTVARSETSFLVIRASSWPINQQDIVDSTGSGDCWIAGFLFGLVNHFKLEVSH
jgi:sugar/nucleoside kinase (ribokinase family)